MGDNRNDDQWRDDDDADPGPARPPRSNRNPPPPFFKFIFWILLFSAIPMLLWWFSDEARKGGPKELSQSEFIQAVLEGRITDATLIYSDSTTRRATVQGKMKDETGAEVSYVSLINATDALLEELGRNNLKLSNRERSAVLTSILSSVIFMAVLVILLYFLFMRQMKSAGRGAMQFGKSRARLAQNMERITFKDVAGVDSAREEVIEIVEYLKDPGKFHRLGGRIPRGVLLVGPPGTGKTLLARAIAGEADVPFFSISGSDFVEMFVGVGASRVRDMFEQAKRNSPCIIFIDEIDAVGRSRFSGMGGGHDEREQTLNALLVEMDGFEVNSGVIVVAATNRPDVLDKALLRPGRFDRMVHVELPDLVGRKEILQVHIKKITVNDEVDIENVARSTPGFSGADLANLINEAALMAARKGKDAVEPEDFEEARDKVMFGKERPWRAMSEKDRRTTACHEAGHALVSIYCSHSDPLHKVSIIPRGRMLGGAMYFPEGDKVSQSRDELFERMMIGAAGRCAEEIVFSDLNSGAYSDIQQVSRLARAMVMSLGMSKKMGFIEYVSTNEDMGYLGHLSRPEFSEQTAREIDAEVRSLVDAAMEKARAILLEHRDQLDKLTDALLEKETLSAEEVYVLFGLPLPERLKHTLEIKRSSRAKRRRKKTGDGDSTEKLDVSDDSGAAGEGVPVETPREEKNSSDTPVADNATEEAPAKEEEGKAESLPDAPQDKPGKGEAKAPAAGEQQAGAPS